MTRPLPIAACLALATFSFVLFSASVFAQTQTAPAQPTPAAATGAPAPPSAQPAAAQPAAAPVLNGKVEDGRLLAYTCQGCHGITGYKNAYPNYHVPRIGGQSTQYLVNALTEYRKGTRKHPTMQAQAQSFSDQDIADISAFLSGLTP